MWVCRRESVNVWRDMSESFKCVDTNYRVWIIFKSQWRKNWFNIKTAEFLNMLNCSVVQTCQYTALTIQAWRIVPDLLLCAPTAVRAVRYIRLFLPPLVVQETKQQLSRRGMGDQAGSCSCYPTDFPPSPPKPGEMLEGEEERGREVEWWWRGRYWILVGWERSRVRAFQLLQEKLFAPIPNPM